MQTGASCPWNLSTLPTRAPGGSAACRARTCALYGAIKRKSFKVERPFAFHLRPPRHFYKPAEAVRQLHLPWRPALSLEQGRAGDDERGTASA